MKNKIIAQHAESAARKLKLNDKCVTCMCWNCEFKARKLVSMITKESLYVAAKYYQGIEQRKVRFFGKTSNKTAHHSEPIHENSEAFTISRLSNDRNTFGIQ